LAEQTPIQQEASQSINENDYFMRDQEEEHDEEIKHEEV
jgi:hypothetical protein